MNEALIAAIAVIVAAVVSAAFGLVPYLLRRGASVSEAWAPLVEKLQTDNEQLRGRMADLEANNRWQMQEIARLNKLIDGNFQVSETAIRDLTEQLEQERQEVSRLRKYIRLLRDQLETAGIIPVSEPGSQGD